MPFSVLRENLGGGASRWPKVFRVMAADESLFRESVVCG
jgi:hypothetical protein